MHHGMNKRMVKCIGARSSEQRGPLQRRRRSREEGEGLALPGAETDSKSAHEGRVAGAAAEPDGEPRNSYASVGNSDV